jgi:broad specificity phosphatase PhoE
VLRLTLVRHGSTEWNEKGRFQGWGDPPLSAKGRGEAERLGAHLAGEEFGLVVTSGLLRARETAALAFPGAEAHTDPRLREMNFGAWDGLTWAECVERDGDLIGRWSEDPSAVTPPGGESLADFEFRIAAALADLPEEGARLWVVHAGVIHAILARWMDVPLRRTFALHISACGITRAEIFPGGGAKVMCVNETAASHRDTEAQR